MNIREVESRAKHAEQSNAKHAKHAEQSKARPAAKHAQAKQSTAQHSTPEQSRHKPDYKIMTRNLPSSLIVEDGSGYTIR